ncbi:PTS system mannitol-specific IIA component/PTS system ascorbate-specific IIA component [Planomicrobium stackebrandtii]|uniref:PTS system mannitol-specific IIA component/PTS system ascorbate-specific IIA component n=2 Tax=Planomicrobium stackebrandtii TaxID=253160 RepID=A0ABU0GSW2_9BACL|nr:PTS system mannitol-specific IIA component/PTS system ascorbate-specific IIA component [Planomicrobium stackebrandtii]
MKFTDSLQISPVEWSYQNKERNFAMKFLEEKLVVLDLPVATPEEGIRAAGALLVAEDLIEPRYVDAMVESYEKNGPYFVLAPLIAMPHARPEDGVKEASVSLVRLKDSLKFGNEANDPVQFIFALGASSSEEHLLVMRKIVSLLSKPENVEKLKILSSYEELQLLIGRN